jgi:uncharacterized protein (TIGR02996 family)
VPQDEALFQAILDKPEDDDLRLVYADWLEEHGDPARAEFIRVQIQLARLSFDDDRREELSLREADLLAEHEAAWTAPFGPLKGISVDPREGFERGLVTRVFVRGVAPLRRHAESLFRLAPVTRVEVFRPESIAELTTLPQLARLTGLILFEGQPLSARTARQLADCPHLAGLRELHLSGCRLSNTGARALAGSRWDRLEYLRLDRNGVGPAGLEALVCSPGLPRLAGLNLAFNPVGRAGARFLAAARACPFTSLQLARCGLGPAGLEALTSSSHLTALRELNLDGNGLGRAAARRLAGWPQLAGVSSLVLSVNNLGDEGVQALADSPFVAGLVGLSLKNCAIHTAGGLALARSPHLQRLRVLNVSNFSGQLPALENDIGPAARAALEQRFGEVYLD